MSPQNDYVEKQQIGNKNFQFLANDLEIPIETNISAEKTEETHRTADNKSVPTEINGQESILTENNL